MNVKGQMLVMRNIIEIILVIGMAFFFISCLSKTVDLFAGNSGTLPERTFLSFVEQVKDISSSNKIGPAYKGRSELFLEDGQAVVYFEPMKELFQVVIEVSHTKGDMQVLVQRPASCGKVACICFIKDSEIITDTAAIKESIKGFEAAALLRPAEIKIKNPSCHQLEKPLTLSTCSIGNKNSAENYACSNGFIIERHLIKKVDDAFGNILDEYFTTPKNLVLTLTNEADKVSISPRSIEP